MGNKIFLSHASADKKLVDRFVDFLKTAFDMTSSDIYYSSQRGTITTGKNFIDSIKDNIKDTKLVVFFVTPNYLKSHFCLSELGAAWVLEESIYPILINPVNGSSLETTPLKGITQYLKIREEDDLIQLADEFKEYDIIEDYIGSTVTAKARSFIRDYEELCQFEEEKFVSIDDHLKLKKEMDQMIEDNVNQDKIIRELNEYISTLESIKNKEDVRELKATGNDEWEQFEDYIDEIKTYFTKVHPMVITAMYHDKFFSSDYGFWPKDNWTTVIELQADKFLIVDEDEYQVIPNYEEYIIHKLMKKLITLSEFIDGGTVTLYEIFESKYEMNLDISSKRVWEALFDVDIQMN
jgi:TIR domain